MATMLISSSSLYSGAEKMLSMLCMALMENNPNEDIVLVASSDELLNSVGSAIGKKKTKARKKIYSNNLVVFLYFFLGFRFLHFLFFRSKIKFTIFNDIESLICYWPMALSSKSFFYLHDSHDLNNIKGRLVCKFISILVDKILVITGARRDLLRGIGVNNSEYFPNCLPPDFFFIEPRRQKEPGNIRCVAVGQITSWKRLDKVVSIFQKMSQEANDRVWSLDIYGRPRMNNQDDLAIERFLVECCERQNSVRYRGYVESAQEIYSDSDVLIHMAKNEPFGLVLLEAIAAGCYVIAAEGEGPLEILADDNRLGYIIPESKLDEIDFHRVNFYLQARAEIDKKVIEKHMAKYLFESYKKNVSRLGLSA